MKKILFICACFFLIGCQATDDPVDDQDAQIDEEENQVEDIDQDEEEDDIVEGETNENPDSEEQTDSDPIGEPDEEIEPEEEDLQDEEEQSTPDETEEENGNYSSDEAVILVREYIQGMHSDIGLNYNFDGVDDQGNYRIQVFEVVVHGEDESHTATYGWYLVNPETGEITDMFD